MLLRRVAEPSNTNSGTPPVALVQPLRDLLAERRRWHDTDLATNHASVDLPFALARKYPNAGKEWAWQYVFATPGYHVNPDTGEERRHHLFDWTIQRHMKDEAGLLFVQAVVAQPAHALRYCLASLPDLLRMPADFKNSTEFFLLLEMLLANSRIACSSCSGVKGLASVRLRVARLRT